MRIGNYILLLVLLTSNFAVGQVKTPRVITTLDPYDEALIGDHIHLSISIELPESTYVKWPSQFDTLTNFDVLEFSEIDSIPNEGQLKLQQTFVLSAYDSGVYMVAPLPFEFYSSSDTLKIRTGPLALKINTLAVDTSAPFKAIKPPIEVPISFAEVWPWVLAVLVVIGLIIFAVYLMKKRAAEDTAPQNVAIKVPPHMHAIRRLEELEAKKLWQQDKIKEYYSQLSEISREYIENRYQVLALESTTDEIVERLKFELLSVEDLLRLEKVLQLSDLVKFAKVKPLADEHIRNLEDVRTFVRNTVPVIVQSRKEEVADV